MDEIPVASETSTDDAAAAPVSEGADGSGEAASAEADQPAVPAEAPAEETNTDETGDS